MRSFGASLWAAGAAILWALAPAGPAGAQEIGTWVRQADSSQTGAGMTMTVEPCCHGGRRLIYHVKGVEGVLTVESPMDGTEVPVLLNGKPSGETMAIKRLDARHTFTVLRMNGQTFGTSRATLSADGRTLTVEDEFTSAAGGHTPGKVIETWVKQ